MITRKAGATVLALMLSAAAASGRAAEVRPLLKMGYDVGGDTLVTALFVGGDTDTIKANEGFYFGAGVSILNEPRDIEVELTFSYKTGFIFADNGDVEWTRLPVEALVFYRFPQVRLGGGLTLHLNPKLRTSGLPSDVNVGFDDALGLVLQADYRFTDKMTLGLRYTSIKYEAKAPFAGSFSGDGIGVTFGLAF